MRRHFDAFVYTACWCSCRLALRVPLDVFRRAELEAFAVRQDLMSTRPARTGSSIGRGTRARTEAAALVRREREAQERAQQEAELRRQRAAHLRRLMAEVDRHWAAIDALTGRGTASGYEQAVRMLADLAAGYALTSTPQEFERALRRVLVPHAKRGALLRRLTAAGLWSG